MTVNHHLANMVNVLMVKIHLVVLVIPVILDIYVNIKSMNVNQILVNMEDYVRIWLMDINVYVKLELPDLIVKLMLMNAIVIHVGITQDVSMVSTGKAQRL